MNDRSLWGFIRARWYYGVGIAVILGLIVVAVLPRAVEVETATVDRGKVLATIVDEGRTRMREVYVVSAPVAGRVLRVAVEPGDRVEKGDPVARMTRGVAGFLDPRLDAEARAAVAAAEARQRAAKADLDLADTEDARAAKLAEARLIADAARDTARARLRAAVAGEAAAAAELRRARSALLEAGRDGGRSEVVLRAPVAGIVLSVPQKSEASINPGTAVVVLGDPARVDVVAEFLSQDAVRVKPGDRAVIENWGERALGGAPVGARVERVEPVARTKISALGIEEQRTRVILEFAGPVPPPLRAHDFRVDARIVTEEVADTVRVPLGALFREGEAWAVFVVRDGRARIQRLAVGPQDEQFRAVSGGLNPGDRVILFPTSSMVDGARVDARPR
jgi:HlyD family secretion protein